MKVCVDAGHGGNDSGAVGPTGTKESTVNLLIARQVKQLLESYAQSVVMTRDNNTGPSLSYRTNLANREKADCFVSIHCNDDERKQGKGMEVWTSPGDTPADRLASLVWAGIQAHVRGQVGRTDYCDGDVDKESRFYVLTATVMPAVLVECGFLSEPEEKAMADPMVQQRMAEGICWGVLEWGRQKR